MDDLKVPVFFVGSTQGDGLTRLDEMLGREVERSLGRYGRHAKALLDRHRRWAAGREPWCLLVLDGLNEYKNPSRPWRRHLSDAYVRAETDLRPAAVSPPGCPRRGHPSCCGSSKTWPDGSERAGKLSQEDPNPVLSSPNIGGSSRSAAMPCWQKERRAITSPPLPRLHVLTLLGALLLDTRY
jgi:hypothetical protein